jgi:hypothetical protein
MGRITPFLAVELVVNVNAYSTELALVLRLRQWRGRDCGA